MKTLNSKQIVESKRQQKLKKVEKKPLSLPPSDDFIFVWNGDWDIILDVDDTDLDGNPVKGAILPRLEKFRNTPGVGGVGKLVKIGQAADNHVRWFGKKFQLKPQGLIILPMKWLRIYPAMKMALTTSMRLAVRPLIPVCWFIPRHGKRLWSIPIASKSIGTNISISSITALTKTMSKCLHSMKLNLEWTRSKDILPWLNSIPIRFLSK